MLKNCLQMKVWNFYKSLFTIHLHNGLPQCCKNRPAWFTGQVSWKAAEPGFCSFMSELWQVFCASSVHVILFLSFWLSVPVIFKMTYCVSSGTLNPTYCKTFNVSVAFISRISRGKQNRKIKGREYQLQAKIGRNCYSISNCMILIRQNKRGQNNFEC